MTRRPPRYVLILAAGKGTRMGAIDRHKVCFEVDGRPVINRAIEIYLKSGIQQPVVVVGVLASQVMATIAREHSDVIYAYQSEPQGTGRAARLGLKLLLSCLNGQDEDILLVAGDRIIDPEALNHLYDFNNLNNCDLAMLVSPKQSRSEQGRVVLNGSGQVLGLVEMRDIWQRETLAKLKSLLSSDGILRRDTVIALMLEHMDEKRAELAFGTLWQDLRTRCSDPSQSEWSTLLQGLEDSFTFTSPALGKMTLIPKEVNASPVVNVSVYLLKASALDYALARLTRDNAQREEYLSDIVNILLQGGYRVQALQVSDPRQVLGYNNPAELLAVEEYIRGKRLIQGVREPAPVSAQPISKWISIFKSGQEELSSGGTGDAISNEFISIYGTDTSLLNERFDSYLTLLYEAYQVLPEDPPVIIVRSPGRANILGRHVDHQGGQCNLLAIDREILMVVHPREDDVITLHNVNHDIFADTRFSIGELVAKLPWDDWVSLVNSQPVQELVGSAKGDWSHYVRSAVLRLQKKYGDRALHGMDFIVHGNIPVAAGLSSSSALVVATAEATVAVNALDLQPAQLVDLCGEGEWFVGTRGGNADHAAVKYSQKGRVTQVSFFPFALTRTVEFPVDYRLVICNSGTQARKALGARDVFNHRVACYRLGLLLVKAEYPQYAPLLQHLRDINTRTLGIPLTWIYRIVKSLPESISREELQDNLPTSELESLLSTHLPQAEDYPIRGVVLFGLAECERSRIGADLLATGKVTEFGQLMNASHNGDRIACYERSGISRPYQYRVSDDYLTYLIEALESRDPERIAAAQLERQPGAYRCSTPEIDQMVDLALQIPGVAGAQLAGAGLGGCMMVLAHHTAIQALGECLRESYYKPRDAVPDISVCIPIAGSGVLFNSNSKMAY